MLYTAHHLFYYHYISTIIISCIIFILPDALSGVPLCRSGGVGALLPYYFLTLWFFFYCFSLVQR